MDLNMHSYANRSLWYNSGQFMYVVYFYGNEMGGMIGEQIP